VSFIVFASVPFVKSVAFFVCAVQQSKNATDFTDFLVVTAGRAVYFVVIEGLSACSPV